MSSRHSRRHFLSRLAWLSLGVPFFGIPGCSRLQNKQIAAASPPPSSKKRESFSRIVEVHSGKVMKKDGAVDDTLVRRMVSLSVEKLTGEKGEQSWKRLFSADDRVAIKVNCLSGRRLSTHPQVVNAIVEGLKSAGVEPGHMIIFDRTTEELISAGFTIRRQGENGGPLCFGTDEPGTGYEQEPTMAGEVASCLSRIIGLSTALINVPVLKDHDVCGISGCLKNNLGSIDNPNKYHPNAGDPYIADINTAAPIRDRTRLFIMDALEGLFDGGPSYNPGGVWNYGSIIAGTDPVAMDARALDIIEAKRKKEGLKSLKDEERYPHYLKTAADGDHQLGSMDSRELIETDLEEVNKP